MKRMVNLRSMSSEQLQKRLVEIDASLVRLRGFNRAGKGPAKGKSKDHPLMIHNLRKMKARILTILTQRETERKETAT